MFTDHLEKRSINADYRRQAFVAIRGTNHES